MRKFQHTVTADDTSARVGSGDLDVLATPRLITWCENAAFQVCKQNIDADHTTVGTMVKIEHVKGSAVGSEITVLCAEPINDGRRLVCHVTVRDSDGEEPRQGRVPPGRRRPGPLHEQVPAGPLTRSHLPAAVATMTV